MSTLHLAIASTTSLPGQLERNLDQIIGFARRAAEDGVQLLLTPELSATGYGSYPEVLALAETAGNGRIYETLARSAQETGVVLCVGFVESGESTALNYLSHYAIYPDGHFVVQRKHCITDSEAPLTPFVPQPQTTARVENDARSSVLIESFDVGGVRCAIAICADSGIANLNEILEAQGVQVLLLPTGSGGQREDRVTTEDLKKRAGREKYFEILQTVFLPGRAPIQCIENRRALAAVNLCGYDGIRHYHIGHGSITNAMGEVLGFFHGLPNLDRQRPMYAHAVIDTEEIVERIES
jgi:predicted amidohydrolase